MHKLLLLQELEALLAFVDLLGYPEKAKILGDAVQIPPLEKSAGLCARPFSNEEDFLHRLFLPKSGSRNRGFLTSFPAVQPQQYFEKPIKRNN